MRLIYVLALVLFAGLAIPKEGNSQTYCTLGEFANSCVNCDGVLITGQAYWNFVGQCYPCTIKCPGNLLPESVGASNVGGTATKQASCGLTWSEFSEQAHAAEQAGVRGGDRYVRLQVDENLLSMLAREAPLIANFLIVRDGHIRLDLSDETLSSLTDEPAMISRSVATTEIANWMIENRAAIHSEEGRKALVPPPQRSLGSDERQVLHTDVERLGPEEMVATIRATHFATSRQPGGKPSILDQKVLVMDLSSGSSERIPDHIRPVLGDNQPGQRIPARITSYDLYADESLELME
jgi:hypothetical protein